MSLMLYRTELLHVTGMGLVPETQFLLFLRCATRPAGSQFRNLDFVESNLRRNRISAIKIELEIAV